MKPKLIIFDLDGTVCVSPKFYGEVYSATLSRVIVEERGNKGLKMLQHYRKNYDGKGELALFALNIPFVKWAEKLVSASLDLIDPQSDLVHLFRDLDIKKIIYTGSPVEMTNRVLSRLGFVDQDFDLIIGWKEPELFPVKWTCSSTVFKLIANRFSVDIKEAWSVGDGWETDLLPARLIGMNTAVIGECSGDPDLCFSKLREFLLFIKTK